MPSSVDAKSIVMVSGPVSSSSPASQLSSGATCSSPFAERKALYTLQSSSAVISAPKTIPADSNKNADTTDSKITRDKSLDLITSRSYPHFWQIQLPRLLILRGQPRYFCYIRFRLEHNRNRDFFALLGTIRPARATPLEARCRDMGLLGQADSAILRSSSKVIMASPNALWAPFTAMPSCDAALESLCQT